VSRLGGYKMIPPPDTIALHTLVIASDFTAPCTLVMTHQDLDRDPYVCQLSGLDRSSPRFSDQLAALLDTKKCGDPNLPTRDAARVIEYLSDVRIPSIRVDFSF